MSMNRGNRIYDLNLSRVPLRPGQENDRSNGDEYLPEEETQARKYEKLFSVGLVGVKLSVSVSHPEEEDRPVGGEAIRHLGTLHGNLVEIELVTSGQSQTRPGTVVVVITACVAGFSIGATVQANGPEVIEFAGLTIHDDGSCTIPVLVLESC